MKSGKTVAFLGIEVEGTLILNDFKVINGANGTFVASPSKKITNSEGKDEYMDTIRYTSKEAKDEFLAAALEAYNASQNPGYKGKAAGKAAPAKSGGSPSIRAAASAANMPDDVWA